MLNIITLYFQHIENDRKIALIVFSRCAEEGKVVLFIYIIKFFSLNTTILKENIHFI